jgi:tetratricopeptide (TPR) repeat protein
MEQAGDYAWQAGDYPSAIAYIGAGFFGASSVKGRQITSGRCLYTKWKTYKAELLWVNCWKGIQAAISISDFSKFIASKKMYPAALRDMLALTEIMPENATHFYLSGLLQMFLQPEHALDYLQKASSLNNDFYAHRIRHKIFTFAGKPKPTIRLIADNPWADFGCSARMGAG